MNLKLLCIPVAAVILGACGNGGSESTPPVGNMAYKLLPSPELEEGLELVYISNGSKQCELGSTPPEVTSQILVKNGIDVISSHCGYLTGMAVAAVCGGSTLEINLHAINAQNVQDAENVGFESVSGLLEQGAGFQVVECI